MVNAALEAKFFRDDVSAFAGEKNSYASKFRNMVDWVLKNHHSVEAALNLPVGATRGLATAMITLYPTISSIFIDDFPCVTVTEFVSAYSLHQRGNLAFSARSPSLVKAATCRPVLTPLPSICSRALGVRSVDGPLNARSFFWLQRQIDVSAAATPRPG